MRGAAPRISRRIALALLAAGTALAPGAAEGSLATPLGRRAESAGVTVAVAARAPSPPAALKVVSRGPTSVVLRWRPSRSAGVVAYGLYRDGRRVGRSRATTTRLTGLICATDYRLGVDAVQRGGRRSARRSVAVRTAACPSKTVADSAAAADQAKPPAGDPSGPSGPVSSAAPGAPAPPGAVSVAGASPTSLTLAWSAAAAAAAGYGVYRDGAFVASTTALSYVLAGLVCGTSYTVELDAYDGAGARSQKVGLAARTSACPDVPAPSPPAASAAVFVSPTGSDAGSCTRAEPCRTFDRAYRIATPGQVVEVAAGSYGYQQINLDPAKIEDADVVFQPAPGTVVTVATLAFGNGQGTPAASHVTVRDIRAGEVQAFTPARDLTWVNLDAGNFYVRGVQQLLVSGGDWGPCRSRDSSCGGNSKIDYPAGEQPNDGITIDGAVFHGYRIDDPGDHYECLFLAGGTNITVRNSRFYDCEFYDIFLQRVEESAAGSFAGLVIEGNWFDTPWNGQGSQERWSAVSFSPRGRPFTDVVLRSNSFHATTGIEWNGDGDGTGYARFHAERNVVGRANGCYPSVTFESNRFTDQACGGNDVAGSLDYVAGGHAPEWDWRLRP